MKRKWLMLASSLMLAGTALAVDSVVRLGGGAGAPGTQNNIISMSLDNVDPVKSMQVQIADLPNCLRPDSVWLTERCRDFNVYYNDVDGNLNIIVISGNQYLAPGSGEVLRISYTVAEDTDTLTQVALHLSKAIVVGQNYVSLPVQIVDNQFTLTGATAVDQRVGMPVAFTLEQNFPNPFNPATQIPFSLQKEGWVRLAVFNSLGQRIRTLVEGHRQPGVYRAMWDGCDDFGRPVAAGLYLYRLDAGSQSLTRHMLYVK
ncbi:MAG TPA: FlgD immunoglobulin-like domain containing protein [bacterium]|nr:FlgD immunoglobulin-like domain containing protein [bacterium]